MKKNITKKILKDPQIFETLVNYIANKRSGRQIKTIPLKTVEKILDIKKKKK